MYEQDPLMITIKAILCELNLIIITNIKFILGYIFYDQVDNKYIYRERIFMRK